jgi:hypothetical protein
MTKNKPIINNTTPKAVKKRKGVHAKTKMSKNKNSSNYSKPYNRQG